MRSGVRRRATAAVLACLLVLTGCSDDDEPAPPPEPTPDVGTPLGEFETRRLAISRAAFCDAIPEDAVARALDGEPTRASSYQPGDRVRLASGVTDVVHEFGCVFRGRRGAEARAWVFAPPTTRSRAGELVQSAGRGGSCATVKGADTFGRPSVATRCVAPPVNPSFSGQRRLSTVTYAGLFGDAWLSCSVRASDLDRGALLDRAGRWCVEVATAARAE